jgi:hypothetical protein
LYATRGRRTEKVAFVHQRRKPNIFHPRFLHFLALFGAFYKYPALS